MYKKHSHPLGWQRFLPKTVVFHYDQPLNNDKIL